MQGRTCSVTRFTYWGGTMSWAFKMLKYIQPIQRE